MYQKTIIHKLDSILLLLSGLHTSATELTLLREFRKIKYSKIYCLILIALQSMSLEKAWNLIPKSHKIRLLWVAYHVFILAKGSARFRFNIHGRIRWCSFANLKRIRWDFILFKSLWMPPVGIFGLAVQRNEAHYFHMQKNFLRSGNNKTLDQKSLYTKNWMHDEEPHSLLAVSADLYNGFR